MEIAMPRNSPWGSVQHLDKISEGIVCVSTASHGGIMVHDSVYGQFSKALGLCSRYGGRYGAWTCFEEDCELAAPALELLEKGAEGIKRVFPSMTVENLVSTLRYSYPDYLEARGIA